MAGNMDESQARAVAGKAWPSFTKTVAETEMGE